ncbi:hexuronate transporter [Escherichia coli]|uniref:MFS transporter n=1 Tax=Escherichia coli TaxID=562 RepID=UPI000DA4D0D8|nr:MFS transporter [Escherichia coli]UTJ27172.1 MFS transporter [Escherichia coli]SRA04904.1 hexuronate transporter [Escherichia coli]
MRKIKGLRWYMIALVTLGTVLGYLTRNTVAAAAPTLMEELNISTQQYSYIIAAYSAAYTVMQPVAGYVLDVLGTKIGYAMFAVLWAVFCGATALAGSWGGLAVARGAVGAAEAAMIPAGLKASSEWFPAKERSIAVGYFNVGSSIGAMIAPPLVVWAIVMHSWQMAFIISGALSFIWAMAWLASTLFALVVGALADTIGFSPLFAVLAVFDLLGALVIWTVLQNKPAIEVAQETHNDPAPQH